jgi:alpha-galactosidase
MQKKKLAMIGAGSGFTISIAKELAAHKLFADWEFCMMDISEPNLRYMTEKVKDILAAAAWKLKMSATTSLSEALDGSSYVITSCEPKRYENWAKDLAIPEQFGVYQVKGENGGPGGMIHGMRNICMFMNILEEMEKRCPDAWLMNFTNPMSILCTYFKNHSPVKALGFCHQVHGSFGVIAEMLDMAPGELEVLSAGVNHLNWLFDVRKKGSGESCMGEFLEKVRESKYWKQRFKNIPEQNFTLEVLNTFNMYPIGYDDHIIEYMPFFWEREEWPLHEVKALTEFYKGLAEKTNLEIKAQSLLGREYIAPPFPRDADHPYYAEKPCQVIVALETNTPTYFDAINIKNNGAVTNLPDDLILDVPAVAIGGKVRSIHVGELPPGPLEICRRQTALHEMIVKATIEGDESLAVQILCLTPYVRSITQARNIWKAYKEEFIDYLPTFKK